jgi:hypothetical protein
MEMRYGDRKPNYKTAIIGCRNTRTAEKIEGSEE